MSQQPAQWSQEAVQIFTKARQIQGIDAQNFYVNQACGANSYLKWEVDWLLQWERSQAAPVAMPQAVAPAGFVQATIKPKRSFGWKWITAISVIGLIFVGFLGVFVYGAYRGVRHLQMDSQAEAMERTAYAQWREGEFDSAARGYERVAELRKTQYGENHSRVSEAVADAASAWFYSRDYEKAASQYEKAYRMDLARVGAKDKLTLDNQRYWALSLLDARHAIQAHEIFQEVISTRKASQGASHEDTARAILDLGRSLETMGRFPEALTQYEVGYDGIKKKLTAYHKDSIDAMESIVRCYDEMGKFDDSLKLLSTVYEGQKTARGFDDAQTDALRESVCKRLEKAEALEQVVRIRQEAYDERLARLTAENPLTIDLKEKLADAKVNQGQHAEAVELLKECLEKRQSISGKESDQYAHCMQSLADAYNALKTPNEGIARFQADADEMKEKYGPRSPATLQAATRVGWCKVRAGDISGGEADLEKVLAESVEALGFQHETSRDLAISLAEHYRKSRQFSKEVELRRRLSAQQSQIAGIEDETTRELLESQADAESDAGNIDAAIDLYKRLHDFETNRSGSGGIYTFFEARSLAMAYLQAGQIPKAIECTDEVMSKLKRQGRADYWTSRTAADLGMLLARIGNAQKSCEAYEFAIEQRENNVYASDYQIEQWYSYWGKQGAAAKATAKAQEVLKKKLEAIKKEVGPDHFIAQSLQLLLGMQAEAAGDLQSAESSYREIEALARDKSIGWLSEAKYRLGGVLLAQGQMKAASDATHEAISLKQSIERNAVDPSPDQEINSVLDVELQLARCLIAENQTAEAIQLLLKINEAKAKLDFLEEGPRDARCRMIALQMLIDLQPQNAEEVARWKAELEKLEKIYTHMGKI